MTVEAHIGLRTKMPIAAYKMLFGTFNLKIDEITYGFMFTDEENKKRIGWWIIDCHGKPKDIERFIKFHHLRYAKGYYLSSFL